MQSFMANIALSQIDTQQQILIPKFNALGDPTRFKLLQLLEQNEDYCVTELANQVGISNAGVSQQLKVLEQAGLITRIRMGQRICYKLDRESMLNMQLLHLIKG